MNLASAIKAARKLGNFLATLYPALGAIGARWSAWLTARPFVARWRDSPRGRALADLIDRFWWSDYARDRVDWSTLPADAVPLLRWLFTAASLLALLLPLAIAWPLAPLAVPSALALALGFGFAMASAAAANRGIAFAVELLGLWLMASSAFGAPRSVANLLPPLAVLANVAMGEARRRPGALARAARALGSGAASGMVGTILTPLALVWPEHKLIFGALWGAPLGLLIAVAAARLPRAPSLVASAVLVAALDVCHLVVFTVRAGLPAAVANWVDVYRLLLGWLWPIWYFVGVGVVFALLKMTRTTIAVVDAFVPRRILAVLLGVALVGTTLLAWSSSIASIITAAPPWLVMPIAWLYRISKVVVWDDPRRSQWFGWLRWVMLFDVLAVGWLALRRRLGTDAWVALASTTLVIAFGMHEYISELFGFQRPQGYGMLLLIGFAVWLLWLLYKIGLRLGGASSPSWPASARLGLSASILVLALGAIHSRVAIGELKVIDEIFLYLLRGVIDIGVPFSLYVWAQRRLANLPVSPARLFGLFAAGAASTLLINFLDQLALAGSLDGVAHLVAARHTSLSETGSDLTLPAVPLPYEIARDGGLLLVGLVFAWRRRQARASSVLVLFELAALALGYASFVRMRVDLPLLPIAWTLYVLPAVPPQFLDGALVTSQAAWLVPMLALATLPPWAALVAAPLARASILGTARVLHPVLERSGLVELELLYAFVLLALVARVTKKLT